MMEAHHNRISFHRWWNNTDMVYFDLLDSREPRAYPIRYVTIELVWVLSRLHVGSEVFR